MKGEVRLKLFSDGVESLASYDCLWVGEVQRRLIDVRASGKGAVARFDGLIDRSAAEGLRGSIIEVDRSALPELGEGEYYHADLIGLTCFSADGETIGSVVGVENYGAGDLLDIELVGGRRSLIPFRDGIADLVDARIILRPEFLA